jgi:hypothetical protein
VNVAGKATGMAARIDVSNKGTISLQGENYDTIEDGEIAYDLEHCFLLRAHNVCSANEFCGAAEFGTNARGRYDRRRFTAPDKSPRVRVCARAGFNGQRFTGEHRLIELN